MTPSSSPYEQGLRLTRELTRAFSEIDDLEEAFGTTLKAICEETGWALGQAWLPDADGERLECSSAWYAASDAVRPFREVSRATRFEAGVGLPGRAWTSRKPEWIPDVAQDPNFPRAPYAIEAGIRSAMAAPVLARDRVVAVLEFFVLEPRDEDEGLFDLVATVAGQLGSLILRRQAEHALRASEERFRAVAETAHDGIVTSDASGLIRFFNLGAERMFGYSAEEVVGRPLTMLMPERFHAAHRAGMERYVATSVPHVIGSTVELAAVRSDGTEFPIELSLAATTQGDEMIFTGILRDITERRVADEAKAMFLATTSHELKTPLTVIHGFAELLAGDRLTDEETRREAAQAIVRRARDLARIVDRILLSSRIEAGKIDLLMGALPLGDLLGHQAGELAAATGREVVFRPPGAGLPAVLADESALGTVLDHLLENAVKYSPDGGSIELAAREDGDRVVIEVTDSGIGMTAEQAAHCFDRFWQAQSGNARPFTGTGIGLYIVRSLVEAMGGTVEAESKPGRGTTFRVTLLAASDPSLSRANP